MKTLIGMTLLAASLVCGSALANEMRRPTASAAQTYKVNPQAYLHQVSFRGDVLLAQQELALQLWQSNRELAESDIAIIGARVEQQFRVANAQPGAGGKLVDGASQK